MEWAIFVLGATYAYVGILLVLVLYTEVRRVCRDVVVLEVLAAVLWPLTLLPALALRWWWTREAAVSAVDEHWLE